MIYGPNGIKPQWKRYYGFMKDFFFDVLMVIVKDWKKYSRKDAMSMKISFIHYIKWTRVMLSVFEEIFLVLFSFSLSLSIGKRLTLAKIWRAAAFPSLTVFYGSGITYTYYKIVIMDYNILLKFCIASCI